MTENIVDAQAQREADKLQQFQERKAEREQREAARREAPSKVNAAGIVALCMGIASFFVMPTILVGTVAITAGIVGCAKAKEEEGMSEGMAVGGLALGILGIGLSLFLTYVMPVYGI